MVADMRAGRWAARTAAVALGLMCAGGAAASGAWATTYCVADPACGLGLTMQTTGTTALSPTNAPPTQISTHGEFDSPRGCRGTFGSVGDASATRIEADFTGTDCPSTFTGRVVLTKS